MKEVYGGEGVGPETFCRNSIRSWENHRSFCFCSPVVLTKCLFLLWFNRFHKGVVIDVGYCIKTGKSSGCSRIRNCTRFTEGFFRNVLLHGEQRRVPHASCTTTGTSDYIIVHGPFRCCVPGRDLVVEAAAGYTGHHYDGCWSFYIQLQSCGVYRRSVAGFLLLSLGVRKTSHPQRWLPALALIASLIPRTVSLALLDRWQLYEITLMAAEGVLSFILVLIFMQSLPILTPQRYQPTLKNEEIVCLIILLASVLTGMIGWQIQGVAVVDIFARYLVVLLAYIAGAAIGSTVGVVTGLVLSLSNMDHIYQMSLLAFSGLLGGLLKEGKKLGVSAGLIVGTLLIGFYMNSGAGLPSSLWASAWAVALFILTPNSWVTQLSKYIPGTEEHHSEQQKYLQKVRDVTAVRVGKFSDVFQALSKSFTLEQPKVDEGQAEEVDYFLSHVTEKTCQSCFKKEKCWVSKFDDTHDLMTDLMHELDEKGNRAGS